MEKKTPTYDDFLLDVSPLQRPFVDSLHDALIASDCEVGVKQAKSGYVVSYTYKPAKRVVANYVFRKKGLIVRIYGDNVGKYAAFLDTLPDALQKAVEKAPVCKRLLDPTKCSGSCPMGNVFTMNGTEHKKCRYNNFMLLLDEESSPYVEAFMQHELRERAAALQ